MGLTRGIEIRFADLRDAAAIASLLAESFAEYEPLYTPEGYAATVITSARLPDLRETPIGRQLHEAFNRESATQADQAQGREGGLAPAVDERTIQPLI